MFLFLTRWLRCHHHKTSLPRPPLANIFWPAACAKYRISCHILHAFQYIFSEGSRETLEGEVYGPAMDFSHQSWYCLPPPDRPPGRHHPPDFRPSRSGRAHCGRTLTDLRRDGYISAIKTGRHNIYTIHSDLPMRHLSQASQTVNEFFGILRNRRAQQKTHA